MAIGVSPLVGVKAWIGFPVPGMLGLTTMTARCQTRDPSRQIAWLGAESGVCLQVRAGIHQQNASTSLSQGEGGHSPTGTGANNDGVPPGVDQV